MNNEINKYKNLLFKKNLRNSTIKNYLWHLNKFFGWLENKEINNKNLNAYSSFLQKKYQKTNSINLQLIILNSYLDFINNDFRFNLLEAENTPLKKLNAIHLAKLLDAPLKNTRAINLRDKVLLEFLYFSGLKVNEISQIKIAQINWAEKILNINNKKIKISLLTWSYLKKYINKRNANNPYLFVNFDRSKKSSTAYLSVRSIERIINKYAKQTLPGIKVNPQIIRNTYASDLKINASLTDIQKKLNFKSKSAYKNYIKKI